MNYVKNTLRAAYNFLILKPLWSLYLDSPSVGSFGGWYGKTESDICATITGVPTIHWDTTGEDECRNLIVRRFESSVSTVANLFYFVAIITLVIDFFSLLRWALRYAFYTCFLDDGVSNGTLSNKNSNIHQR